MALISFYNPCLCACAVFCKRTAFTSYRFVSNIATRFVLLAVLVGGLVGLSSLTCAFAAQDDAPIALNYGDSQEHNSQAQGSQAQHSSADTSAVPDSPTQNQENTQTDTFTQSDYYALEHILPVIKSKQEVLQIHEAARLMAENRKLKPVDAAQATSPSPNELPYHEQLTDTLYVFYVFDMPNSMRFVQIEDITALELDTRKLRQQTSANLQAHFATQNPELYPIEENGHRFFAYMADGVYESSAILVADKLAQQAKVANPAVFIPSRGVFLLVSGNEKGALDYVQSVASAMYKADDYAITDKPLFLSGFDFSKPKESASNSAKARTATP